ncbi:16586_t:CDS:2, partial [Funneliformis geosporum]
MSDIKLEHFQKVLKSKNTFEYYLYLKKILFSLIVNLESLIKNLIRLNFPELYNDFNIELPGIKTNLSFFKSFAINLSITDENDELNSIRQGATDPHKDKHDCKYVFYVIVVFGKFEGGDLVLSEIGIVIEVKLILSPITSTYLPINPWIPSAKFLNLQTKFNLNILNQFIYAACAFCGRLMYSEKCEWLNYDKTLFYPLLQAYPEKQPELLLTFHVKPPKRIAICLSCKDPTKRYIFSFLYPIPNEIQAVPLKKRIYLSPVFMHCSLGRNSNYSTMYSEYKTLTGTMNFSKNMRSLILYSGMVGAYLEDNNPMADTSWLNDTLITAADWLKLYNPFLKNYSRLLNLSGSNTANPFP